MKGMQFQFLTKNNREYRNHKMGNPEKLATLGTQDDKHQIKKNTMQNIYTALIIFHYFVSLQCLSFIFVIV
jgi:hypothetical protein